jgi:hypothetical protein
MNKVFRAAYVCIFLWFLRRLRLKLSPSSEGLPRYIAVVFAGMPEALLIGYSDDPSLIQWLCDESKWAPTICEFDGYGWKLCDIVDVDTREAAVLRTPRDRSRNAPGGYEEYDMMVAAQYNCTERMMARIARIGTERYFH